MNEVEQIRMRRRVERNPFAVAAVFLSALMAAVPGYTVAATDSSSALASSRSTPAKQSSVPEDARIRPFRVSVPSADLAELRKRIAATRWPTAPTF